MEIFNEYQQSLPAKYNGCVQVNNVTDGLVRLGIGGPYLMPNCFAVCAPNPIIEKGLNNGLLIKFEFSTDSGAESKNKKSKKSEDDVVVEAVIEEDSAATKEEPEVATEPEL